MSKTLRLILLSVLVCVCQTNLAEYIRIAGVAPNLLLITLTVITSYCGSYGGFCVGTLMALLYDASIGYALALNLILYPALGLGAPYLRSKLDRLLKKLKHKSYMEMVLICLLMVLIREIICMGYLFVFGAAMGLRTILRALLCAGYSALLVLPCTWPVRVIMTWHPGRKKQTGDFIEDENVTETHR